MNFRKGQRVRLTNLERFPGDPGTNSFMENLLESRPIFTIAEDVIQSGSNVYVLENTWTWAEKWLIPAKTINLDNL